MNKNIEKRIQTHAVLIYIAVAAFSIGVICYFYSLNKKIRIQKERIEQYHNVFSLTNDVILSVEDAQSTANHFLFSAQKQSLKEFRALLQEIEQKIDSLSRIIEQEEQYKTLQEINSSLKKKDTLILELNNLFSHPDLFAPLRNRLEDYNPVVKEDLIIVISQHDTIISFPNKHNFWKRLGWAFSPARSNRETLNASTSVTTIDTIKNIAVDSLTVVDDMRELSEKASQNYSYKISKIEKKLDQLLMSEHELSTQISALLVKLHRQTLDSTLNGIQKNEKLTRKNQVFFIIIGSFLLLLVLILVILILREVKKGYWLREELAEQKQKIEALMQSRHQLLLSVSHDMKTPLNSILGYLDLWSAESQQEKEQQQIQSMQSSAKYMLSLLTNLLEYSRLEQGGVQIANTEFDCVGLCEKINEMFVPLAEQKQLNFVFENHLNNLKYIVCDELKLKQIIVNLLSNAVKYTLEGSVTFSITESKNNLFIQVKDTGVGIEKEKLKEIFRPFVRFDNPQTYTEGSGLGMTVVKGLVKALDGEIQVKSKLGEGTDIRICIPVKQAVVLNASLSNIPKNKIVKNHSNVLIIDDDNALLLVLREMLSKIGCTTTLCRHIHQLTPILPMLSHYDFVLTDMNMGAYSGKDMLKQIREINSKIPVFVMTALSNFDVVKAKELGFNGYLQKPFSLDMLSEFIEINFPNNKIDAELENEPSSLYDLFDGDEYAIDEILGVFVKSIKEDVEKLQIAVSGNDFTTVYELAHKMLPMMAQLDEKELMKIIESINASKRKIEGFSPDWKNETLHLIEKLTTFVVVQENK